MKKEDFICFLAEDEKKQSVRRHVIESYKTFSDLKSSSCEEQLRAAQRWGILDVRNYVVPGEKTACLHPGDPLTAKELAVISVDYLSQGRVVAQLHRRRYPWSDQPLTTYEKGALCFAFSNGLLSESELQQPHKPVGDVCTQACLKRLCMLRRKPEMQVIPSKEEDTLWVGTMPFDHIQVEQGKYIPYSLRPGWLEQITNADNWGSLLDQTDVYKLYFNILPAIVYDGEADLRLQDDEMKHLIAFLRKHHLLSAFDLGGVRYLPDVPLEQLGKEYAKAELELGLRRWHQCGGDIDYICVSNAIFTLIRQLRRLPEKPQLSSREMYDLAINCVVDYFEVMAAEYAHVSFGCLESMGFYELDPQWYPSYFEGDFKPSFEEHVDNLLTCMSNRGLVLDHFHLDCSIQDVEADTLRNKGSLINAQGDRVYDLGKLELARDICQREGLRCGYLFNSGGEGQDVLGSSDEKVCDKMLKTYQHYAAHGLQLDYLEMQSWNYYPRQTGSVSQQYSELWLYNRFLEIAGKTQFTAKKP